MKFLSNFCRNKVKKYPHDHFLHKKPDLSKEKKSVAS